MMKRVTLGVCALGTGVMVAKGLDCIRTDDPYRAVVAFTSAAFWIASVVVQIRWWRRRRT